MHGWFSNISCSGDSTLPGKTKERGKGGAEHKGSYKICAELTHKEIAVPSLALNRSSFKTRETLADPFVAPSVLSSYILILIIFTPCE